ncbi:hypothetical protein B566_EDAN001389 [Ephemera danica]|nr:hypothetical protein B566_EDAN001389 [Ephemera danica]
MCSGLVVPSAAMSPCNAQLGNSERLNDHHPHVAWGHRSVLLCTYGMEPTKYNLSGTRPLKRPNILAQVEQLQPNKRNGTFNTNTNNSSGQCSINKQRQALPVFKAKNRIISTIKENPCVILIGETASGKTTQVPQFIMDSGIVKNRMIAITQPRRVAAVTVAQRVAFECSSTIGDRVGYAVRFEDLCSPKTKLKFLTDGLLLREAMLDPLLMAYNVIILDEAHERTIATDVLFGVVVVMSATMDVDAMRSYFTPKGSRGLIPVVWVEGRTHQVEVQQTEEGGHPLHVVPLYSALPQDQQALAFRRAAVGCRKVVLATNIAETSVTITDIRHVIDSGMVKARDEILSLVALLSGEGVLLTSTNQRAEAQVSQAKFKSICGDHETLLTIYRAFCAAKQKKMFCLENHLSLRALQHATQIREQLELICDRAGLTPSSCGTDLSVVRNCLITGLFNNVATHQRDKSYFTLNKQHVVSLHPSSVLFSVMPPPPCVLYTELVHTARNYMRQVSVIEPSWISEQHPELARRLPASLANKDVS